jgi:1-acyl-sn-glycerol-3-phosphate acyltransferase
MVTTIRSAIILIYTLLATIIFGSTAIAASYFSKTGNGPHKVARVWAKSILFVSGIDVTVNGLSNLGNNRSCVYMVNHQSNFDIPVLQGFLPVQFRWLAKAELFKIPLLSRGMRGCGYISIDRSNRESAIESLDRAAETIKHGTSVLIFPEGTRSADGNIKSFKKGGFVLTIDAGVPIIPLVIHGTWSIMPKKQVLIRPRPVTLEILPAIDTTGYRRDTKEALMEEVREVMCRNFENLAGERACS